MNPDSLLPAMLGSLVLFSFIPARSAQPEQAPRYQFEPGQELVYEGSSRFRYENGSHGTTDKTTFWVTRRNGDGSWHVLAHNESTFSQSHGKDDSHLAPGRKEEAFGAFDLFPDGRVANPPEGYQERRLPGTFIPLPVDAAKAKTGWEQDQEAGDKSLYRLAPQSDPAAGKWIFEKTDQGLFNVVYLSTSKALVHFDAKRGLITKVDSEYTQGYGFNGKGTGTLELKVDRERDAAWIAQIAQEAEVLEQAKAVVRDASKVLQKGGKPKDEITAGVEKALRSGRDKVKLPLLVAQFEAQLGQFKQSEDYFAEEKKREDEVLNKPAADWETTDLDGNKQTLAGYRGKVVVLDFWYRGCGWCIKAMPQIKEVTDHYKGEPVAVLGMNTDRDDKDARFVVDKLKLNYATLKAEGLPEKYGVQGFPTLIIIDQKGIVRGRHVGYSPTLREELVKTIDGLLATGPRSPSAPPSAPLESPGSSERSTPTPP